MMDMESLKQYDDFFGTMTYIWWCPKCKVNHYTPYCPIEEYERLARLWKSMEYEFCPHCGQIMRNKK